MEAKFVSIIGITNFSYFKKTAYSVRFIPILMASKVRTKTNKGFGCG